MKDRINLFEKEEDHCKRLKVINFYNKNYIESKINVDRYKTLSIKEYLNENKQ